MALAVTKNVILVDQERDLARQCCLAGIWHANCRSPMSDTYFNHHSGAKK
jgi:hypothetical protein